MTIRRTLAVVLAAALVMTLAPAAALAVDTTRTPAGQSVGVFDPDSGQWTLRDRFGNETSFFFGVPGDIPFMGDWNGDGVDTPGLYRQSTGLAYITNRNATGVADVSFIFGNPGDIPLAGDFDGDGRDTISVYRPSEGRAFIINKLGADGGSLGPAEKDYYFGVPGDTPVAGDWNGDGTDSIGLYRESTGQFYYRNTQTTGAADAQFYFGDPGDRFVAGDWQRGGADRLGIFRPADGKFYLRYGLSQGAADLSVALGSSSSIPVAGDFALPTAKDIVDTAVADGRFTTLAAALGAAGLVDDLKGPGPFTVFAPTDDAFAKLGSETINALLADIPTLTDILLYHVVSGEVPASAVVNLTKAETLNGQDVTIKVTGNTVMINDATVTITDVYASNGVIHVIDTVLIPPMRNIVEVAEKDGNFTTLLAALGATGLDATLEGPGPFTVFAPTDAAFAKLPAGTVEALLADLPTLSSILLYHVVSGEVPASTVVTLPRATTVNGSDVKIRVVDGKVILSDGKGNDVMVTATDVMASNGIIHVIDAVLMPPADIVDTAVANGFSTLATALVAAGLDDDLRGDGPFTVFAPTDAAFAALPPGTLDALLADIPTLSDILLYHVTSGKLYAENVVAQTSLSMLNGGTVGVSTEGGVFLIDGVHGMSQVTVTDVLASNGVIHVIDAVLLPPSS